MVEVLSEEPSFVPDVYFNEVYGRADARTLKGDWITIAGSSGDWQMPVVLTDLGDGLREATSPYGYSGIHVAEGVTVADAENEWDSAHELLSGLGVVSLFMRFSPLDAHSVTMADRFEGLTIRRSGTTYVVNIAERGRMWDGLKSSCRSRIRKALKNGYTGDVRPAEGQDLAPGGDFRRLYDQTMQRLDAAPLYFFTDDYYTELLDGLGRNLLIAEVRDQAGDAVSAALLMRQGERLHYHLAGSTVDGALMGSNNLMMWTAIQFAFEQDLRQFHLGGGLDDSDGLARFKRSFGGEALDFHTGRAVIDAAAFSRLTQARADQLGTTVVALEETGFFPPFRASVG